MSKTKIVMTRSLLPVDRQYITDGLAAIVGDQFELVAPEQYDEDGICSVAADADVLLGPYVTPKILQTATKLKLIQVPWTGMDTFDFKAMQGSGITVCNSHSNAAAVAELGFAIILDLLKKVSYHDRKMRRGDWNRGQSPLSLKSKMLSQQTICILGYGSIGARLGEMLQAFGVRVLAVCNHKRQSENNVEFYMAADKMEAVKKADVVVIALPLTDATRGLVNTEFISRMREGSMLVNLSRAAIVDEDALYTALTEGRVGGYGSDVWWNAPKRGESESYVSAKHRFEELEQIVLSPHRAGFCEGALPHLDDVIVNLSRLIQGKELMNQVKIEEEY